MPEPTAMGATVDRREPLRLVVVTGLSGAGRSTALKALEDIGYEAVDNLPLTLLPSLVELSLSARDDKAPRPIAVALDSRTRDFSTDALEAAIEPVRAHPHIEASLVFIDCEDEVLRRRFTETRRRHPLATDRPVRDGIEHERRLISRLRNRARLVIDTSELGINDLRRVIEGEFALEAGAILSIMVTSFSYRRGLPREADLVFDVRFLANPHYDESLRALTGADAEVAAYVARDPAFGQFFDTVRKLLLDLLPHYAREGKRYLTIAIGCTGGRHRSVMVAESLAKLLRETRHRVNLRHRDMDLPAGG
jgi:UPF0042 nucleotide-binding protein